MADRADGGRSRRVAAGTDRGDRRALRGEADIVLGNIAWSNLFNVLLILGTTAVVRPMVAPPTAVTVELPVMTGFAVLLMLVVANGLLVHRWEGALLVVAYIGFVAWQLVGG